MYRLSLSFSKLVMMSSDPAKSAGDARYASQDPFIHFPIQSRLQSVLRVRPFYVERNLCNPLVRKRVRGGASQHVSY